MKAFHLPHLLVGLAMMAAGVWAVALTPRQFIAHQGPAISLEAMIPKQFGEWKLDETITRLMVSPDLKSDLDNAYDQVLTRNYVNSEEELIMLSIAFGSDQSRRRRVHWPEVCYPAQGFQIGSVSRSVIDVGGSKLPVTKFVATQGRRTEPITYWIMIGDSVVGEYLEFKYAKFKYGLTGKMPYGMVIRVSTISKNESQSYRTEERFVRDMLEAMPMEYRKVLIGTDL